jgi:hypothetical protein
MMNRPGRGPRFFNARVAVVAALSFIIFIGTLSVYSAAAAGKLVYIANGPVNAGQRLEASLFDVTQVKGDFEDAFVIGQKEFDELVGSVVIGNLVAGDMLRNSDVFTVTEAGLGEANLTDGSRLSALLATKELRAVVLLDDQSSTYAKAGDTLDIYGVLGSGDDAIVSFCFSKPAIYVLPRTIPNLPDADKWLPEGTAYVLGGVTAEEAGQLITIQERGTVRIAVARPDADPVTGSCSTRFSAEGYAIDGVITNPDGTPILPIPTPSPDATVAP